MMDLKSCIREVPNFPKEGILFFDVTTLFLNPQALGAVAPFGAAYAEPERREDRRSEPRFSYARRYDIMNIGDKKGKR